MYEAKLRRLKNEAREAAWKRGHERLDVFHTVKGKPHAIATCPCGAWVMVNAKPMPNEIDIGGTAVAEGCTYAASIWVSRVPFREYACSNRIVWGEANTSHVDR